MLGHLVNLTFSQIVILSNWHFIILTFYQMHQLEISSIWNFNNFHQFEISSIWNFHQFEISSTWNCINLKFHQLDTSSINLSVHLIHQHVISSMAFYQNDNLSICHFVNCTFCQLETLSTRHFVNWTFCQLDILSTGYFVKWTFCQSPKTTQSASHLTKGHQGELLILHSHLSSSYRILSTPWLFSLLKYFWKVTKLQVNEM